MRAPFLAFPVPAPMAAPLPAPTAAPVSVPQPAVTIASKVNPASIRMTRVFIIGFFSYFRISPNMVTRSRRYRHIAHRMDARGIAARRGVMHEYTQPPQANRLYPLPLHRTVQQILCHMPDTSLRAVASVALN